MKSESKDELVSPRIPKVAKFWQKKSFSSRRKIAILLLTLLDGHGCNWSKDFKMNIVLYCSGLDYEVPVATSITRAGYRKPNISLLHLCKQLLILQN